MRRRDVVIEPMFASHEWHVRRLQDLAGHPVSCPKEISAWTIARDRQPLVAQTRDKDVLGFIVFRITASVVVVEQLIVHPRFRRRGIGRGLLKKTLSHIRGNVPVAVALVDEWNQIGQKFLCRCGFKAMGMQQGKISFEVTVSSYQGFLVLESILEGEGKVIY